MPNELRMFRVADWWDPVDAQGSDDEERFANAQAVAKARHSEAKRRWCHEREGVPLPPGLVHGR